MIRIKSSVLSVLVCVSVFKRVLKAKLKRGQRIYSRPCSVSEETAETTC